MMLSVVNGQALRARLGALRWSVSQWECTGRECLPLHLADRGYRMEFWEDVKGKFHAEGRAAFLLDNDLNIIQAWNYWPSLGELLEIEQQKGQGAK